MRRMTREEMQEFFKKEKEKRDKMPLKDYLITFTMDDSKQFIAAIKAKDEYDVRRQWEGNKYINYQNAENSKQSFTLVKDKVIYVEFEAR